MFWNGALELGDRDPLSSANLNPSLHVLIEDEWEARALLYMCQLGQYGADDLVDAYSSRGNRPVDAMDLHRTEAQAINDGVRAGRIFRRGQDVDRVV